MKKFITIILFSILLLSSCNSANVPADTTALTTQPPIEKEEQKYKIWDLNVGRTTMFNIDKNNVLDDFYLIISSGAYIDDSVTKDVTCTFNGVSYAVSYSFSENFNGVYPVVDYYMNEEIDVFIGIDRMSSKIVYFDKTRKYHSNYYPDGYYPDNDETNIDNLNFRKLECLEIAKEYLSNELDDFSEFELTKNLHTEDGEEFFFKFHRYIRGIKTVETIEITVDASGEILIYRLINYGAIDDAALPSEEIITQIEQNLHNYIKSVYEGYAYRYEYSIEDATFFRLYEEDRYVFYFYTHERFTRSLEDEQRSPLENHIGYHNKYVVYV